LRAKRKRKKCLVIPGDGDPCPRCGEPMQIREYDSVDEELPSYPFFHPLVLLHEQHMQNDLGYACALQGSGVVARSACEARIKMSRRERPSAPPPNVRWACLITHLGSDPADQRLRRISRLGSATLTCLCFSVILSVRRTEKGHQARWPKL
jgi:hypothetical protein